MVSDLVGWMHPWTPKKRAACKVSSVHQAVKAAKAHVQATWLHVLKTQSFVSNTRLPLLYVHSCWFCGACSRHHMMHGCKPHNNDWTKRRLGVWTCKLPSIHQPNGGLLWQECITRFLAFHEHPSGYLLEFDFITTLFPSLGFVELWWSFDQFNCAFSLFAPGVLLC